MTVLATYFMLDCSASMHGPKHQAMIDVYDLILGCLTQGFPDSASVSISAISYASDVTVLFHKQAINPRPALPDLTMAGVTRLVPAFHQLQKWLDDDESNALVFWLTDNGHADDVSVIGVGLFPFHERLNLVRVSIHSTVPLDSFVPVDREIDIMNASELREYIKSIVQNLA